MIYSKRLAETWKLGRYEDKILIANEHFLNFDKFKATRKIAERDNLVGSIGRLSAEKGISNFVEASDEIFKKKSDVKFLIGGSGALDSKVKEYLDIRKLSTRVIMVGWIPRKEIPKYLNMLKLFVLPSYSEGLPNVLLEAMACGTPVLATPVGAIPDIIKESETGFLLRSNNPKHIAERIVELLSKPELLNKVSVNAYRFVLENFSYEKTLEAWRKIFSELSLS